MAWLAEGSLPKPVEVWLKINSGMNRLGFRPEQALAAASALQTQPAARLTTIMTHFATADDERGVAAQWQRFQPVAKASGLAISAANSAAVFRHPHTHGSIVRPGITLYGCSPCRSEWRRAGATTGNDTVGGHHRHPASAGGRIGRLWHAIHRRAADALSALLACGYADGYPRIVRNGTPVLVDGVRTGTVGRVSMDMMAVDLTPIPGQPWQPSGVVGGWAGHRGCRRRSGDNRLRTDVCRGTACPARDTRLIFTSFQPKRPLSDSGLFYVKQG